MPNQGLQLVAGLHQVHLRARFVRFELRQLQIEPLVIQLANVARVVTVMVDLQLMPEAAQIVLRQFQRRFGQQQCGEALLDLQGGLPYLIVILRLGLRRLSPAHYPGASAASARARRAATAAKL